MHSTYAFSTDTQAFLKADHSFIQIRRMWGSSSITFNNFSLQGGPHHRAIYQKDGYSGQLNLMNGMISNFGIVNYSQSSQNAPFDLNGATNALVVELKDVHLLMDNVTIKDNIRSHYSHSSTDLFVWIKTLHCAVYERMESMDISNSTIENNCHYQYYNTSTRITNSEGRYCQNTGTPNADDYTERIRAYDYECNQWTFSAIRHRIFISFADEHYRLNHQRQ